MDSLINFGTLLFLLTPSNQGVSVELAHEKRHLLSRQRDEHRERLCSLELLITDYHKQCEGIHRQYRKKVFNREITRASRYREEKSFWEYLNNIIEDIHLFTWRRAALATLSVQYNRKRQLLEKELRELETTHRKERITLRYASPPPQENGPESETGSPTPRFLMQ